jgi:hypothetical protein
MRVVRTFALALAACACLVPWARPAHAVPAFARAYKTPCTTCHVQFPKLNAFGMAFKQRGYRMPGQKGQFVWKKDNLPLAALAQVTYERLDTPGATSGTVDRRGLDFFSAGSVGPRVSYFLDYGFDVSDFTTAGGDTGSVTTMVPGGTFLIFDDLVSNSRLNLRAGVMSDEFFYLASARRTTIADYMAPVSPDHTGVEVNGVTGSGLRYAAGFGDDEMVGVDGVSNNLRAGYGWVTYGMPGQTLGARLIAAQAGASPAADGTHTQVDLNADLHAGPANLILAYYAQDNMGGVPGDKQTNWLAEAIYPALRTVLLTARYEAQDTKVGGAAVPGTDSQTVLNASYYLLPNMKLQAEYSGMDEEEENTREERVTFGFAAGL